MLFKQTILYMPAQLLGPLFQFLSIIGWTHFANEGNRRHCHIADGGA